MRLSLRFYAAALLHEALDLRVSAFLVWRLGDTLARLPDYKITKLDELLPWRSRSAIP